MDIPVLKHTPKIGNIYPIFFQKNIGYIFPALLARSEHYIVLKVKMIPFRTFPPSLFLPHHLL